MKHFYTLALALSLGLAACGGKSSGGAGGGGGDTTVAAGPTCADVGANMSAQMQAAMPDVPADVIAQAGDVAATSCTEDAWSPESVKCFAELQGGDSSGCDATLSQEQQDGLGRRLGEMLNAASGGGEPMPEEGGEGEGGGDW